MGFYEKAFWCITITLAFFTLLYLGIYFHSLFLKLFAIGFVVGILITIYKLWF